VSQASSDGVSEEHNAVAAAVIHKTICDEYGIKTAKQTWLHLPEAMTKTEKVKIFWDFEIRTDRVIPARRPDIVVMDKKVITSTLEL
jgi:hypothetical protein